MFEHLAILAGFTFLYSVVAGRIDKMAISGPIIFTTFGLICGPLGFGFLTLEKDLELLRTLAELTLALVLFTDAANTNLSVLRQSENIPTRLLLIGLPLTILFGFAVAPLVLTGLTMIEMAILATMLAPTDAALGKAVVSNPSVPANIREGLNVESGINDGICVPVLFLLLAVASGSGEGNTGSSLALKLMTEQLGIGLAVGLGFAILGAWMLRQGARRGWITDTWKQILVMALAFASFATAQVFQGSGFIACFSGGLLFGALAKGHKEELLEAGEGFGDTLGLVTWVVFGSMIVGPVLMRLTWPVVAYAILSLTVIRMVPVFLALMGSGIGTEGKLFMGWFGPRGLASIVFAVIVVQEHLPGDEVLTAVVAFTVLLSILAHGITANPWVRAMAAAPPSA
jgi:NhaP-type Na+/H+ or K+/H+ antiporter